MTATNRRAGLLPVNGFDPESGDRPDAFATTPMVAQYPDGFLASLEAHLPRLLSHLRRFKGHEFANYKPECFASAVERRMQRLGVSSVVTYCNQFASRDAEVAKLFQELLIGTTCFFRDGDPWDSLSGEVDRLVRTLPDRGVFRAWVPACSTGEDVFSVAMIVLEAVARTGRRVAARIFGTDINAAALDHGRRGRYSPTIHREVSRERLASFFSKGASHYAVRPFVREMVLFGQQNVLTDPPIVNVDLLVCRNFLIYIDSSTRAHLLSLFHYCLRPDGVLFLGNSETAENAGLFAPAHRSHRIYRLAPAATERPRLAWPILVDSSVRVQRNSSDAVGSLEPVRASPAVEPKGVGRRSPTGIVSEGRNRLRTARTAGIPELVLADDGLRAALEELVSTNEQLETSREEIALLNDELRTTNEALEEEVDSLLKARDDVRNLAEGAGLAAVVVSNDLRILRFTDRVRPFLPVRPADVGRPLSDLSSGLEYERLIEDAREAIETLEVKEVATKMGDANVLVRMTPYRTADNRIDGLVIAFVEVDALVQSLRSAGLAVFVLETPEPGSVPESASRRAQTIQKGPPGGG